VGGNAIAFRCAQFVGQHCPVVILVVGFTLAMGPAFAQTGACCNYFTGVCHDNVPVYGCGSEQGWHQGVTCANLQPPCESVLGAQCNHLTGNCSEWFEFGCFGSYCETFVGEYCFEIECRPPSIIYVDQNATGPMHDGTSWCTAFTDLQQGIAVAKPADTVRVADGVYKPDPTGLANSRLATFNMKSGVTIEGGYAGCGADDPDERSIMGFASVLSGDLNGDDGPGFANYQENCYHVVTGSRVDSTAVLDGFVVTGGNANVLFEHVSGGGVYLLSSNATVSRCLVIGNRASGGGGVAAGGESPTLRDCVVMGNIANAGGGIFAFGGPHQFIVKGCTIHANVAVVGAGAAASQDQHISIMNSIVWQNTVGGVSDEETQLDLSSGATVSFDYSCVQGWTGSFGGTGNIGDYPLFIDEDGADDLVGTLDDDLRLRPGSPCGNAGDLSLTFDPADVDLDGHARILCGRVDMGAYESGIGDSDCNAAINLRDFAALQNCFASDSTPYGVGCESFDFEGDGDVDLWDYKAFFAPFTGGGTP